MGRWSRTPGRKKANDKETGMIQRACLPLARCEGLDLEFEFTTSLAFQFHQAVTVKVCNL